jgi:predicted nucleic acid-binding protein
MIAPVMLFSSTRTPHFVLDVSVVSAWLLIGRSSVYTADVQWHMIREAAIVPSLWLPALVDELLVAERTGETTLAKVDWFLGMLPTLPILIDEETEFRAPGDTLALARAHGLSVSDAAYIELALRLNLPLATTDPALTRACATAGASIFTP